MVTRSCLECDPKYFKDVIWLLENLVPQNTPSRTAFLCQQLQELRDLSTKAHQGKKRLRVLGVRQVISVREWLKGKLKNLKQKPWKGEGFKGRSHCCLMGNMSHFHYRHYFCIIHQKKMKVKLEEMKKIANTLME
ncbi:izumo sperm-egg fusion protein 3 [Phascolarctos cinereus]